MKLLQYPDSEMMMMELAQTLAGDLNNALLDNPSATLVVPGGTTPGPVFDSLCAADLDWSRVKIMLSDERWVPDTSERSNTALLRQRLLVNRAAAATYVPLYGDAETPEDLLDDLATTVAEALPVSVMLLGMGADMHTASLFPGADKLAEALSPDAAPLMAMRAPGAPEPRITLTAPVLATAMAIHIVIKGKDKLDALERAQGLLPEEAPVAVVLKNATVHWSEA